MTIFYQNRACETHKKMIFQMFSPILFYFSDFIVKIVLFVGANIRAKLGPVSYTHLTLPTNSRV